MLAQTLLVCGAYALSFVIGSTIVRKSPPIGRYFGMVVGQGCALSMPFLFSKDYPTTRFLLTAIALLSVLRLWETARRVAADTRAYESLGKYLLFYTGIAEVQFQESGQKQAARRDGRLRFGRALVKLAALLLLLALDYWFGLRAVGGVVETAWDLMAAYSSASAITDAYGGLMMQLSGHRYAEVFRAPPIARSPADFWGKRWNLTFRNASHRLIFSPLCRRVPVRVAMLVVFVWSAAVHEYIVLGSLGYTQGHMTCFFLLQGGAVVVQNAFKRRKKLPAVWAVALHWAWMLATSPLFFVPAEKIFLSQGNPLSLIF